MPDEGKEKQQLILQKFLELVPFDGWNVRTLSIAARDVGYSEFDLHRLMGENPLRQISFYFAEYINNLHSQAVDMKKLASLRLGEKMKELLRVRIDLLAQNKSAVRHYCAYITSPLHTDIMLKSTTQAVDLMWRICGDKSLDFNYYTKRMILGGVYTKVILYFLSDDSDNHEDTKDFIGRQIDGVLKFGKWKKDLTEKVFSFLPEPLKAVVR